MSPLRAVRAGDPSLPPVLLLHGFMGSAADWSGITDALAGGHRCVAPDLPGHGGSTGLAVPYTMEGAVRAVLEVMDAEGMAAPAIIGYSMGGRVALRLALRYPDRCGALLLEGTSPGLEDAGERLRRRERDEGRARRLEAGDLEGFLREWYAQPLFASLAGDGALLEATVAARLRNDPRELARSLRGMGTGSMSSLWGELASLAVPALAVAGELDHKFVGISRRMAATSPTLRTAVVPGAGHNVHAEAPGAFLDLLRGLLAPPPGPSPGAG